MKKPEKSKQPHNPALRYFGLGVVGVLTVLGLLFSIAFFGATSATGAREQSDRFLQLMRDDKAVEAYELTSSVFQRNTGFKEMEEAVSGVSTLFVEQPIFIGEDSAPSEGVMQSVFTYQARGLDTINYRFTQILLEENDEWKILNFTLQPEAERT